MAIVMGLVLGGLAPVGTLAQTSVPAAAPPIAANAGHVAKFGSELFAKYLISIEVAGTLLLVSHDRAFLDKTITSTLVMQGHGRVGEFVGGYTDWRRQSGGSDSPREASPGPAASTPRPASSSQPRPQPQPAGTPSPEAMARLQAAVARQPAAAPRAEAPGEAQGDKRFGINSLINRMTGQPEHGGPVT